MFSISITAPFAAEETILEIYSLMGHIHTKSLLKEVREREPLKNQAPSVWTQRRHRLVIG